MAGMTKYIRALVVKVGQDGYGPKGVNPIYKVVGKDGREYTVSRHQWIAYGTRWGWCAHTKDETAKKQNVYGDDMYELLSNLGYTHTELTGEEE